MCEVPRSTVSQYVVTISWCVGSVLFSGRVDKSGPLLEEWWFAARFASGMPPELGPGARAHILATAEEKERAAPEKKKVGLEKARAAALLAAREADRAVLKVLGELAWLRPIRPANYLYLSILTN